MNSMAQRLSADSSIATSLRGRRPSIVLAGLLELPCDRREFVVGPAGFQAVAEDAAPVGLGAVVQGVPVPVLDHPGAARDHAPHGLAGLAAVEGKLSAEPPIEVALVSMTRKGSWRMPRAMSFWR